MSLKERMHHTTVCLHQVLPPSFGEALMIIKEAAPLVQGFEALCLPEYVAKYGTDHRHLSLPALCFLTRFLSSEMAIRPFLAQNSKKTMPYLLAWAEDKNEHVRRLASEGCRPRLPWAVALPEFKKDPGLIFPILEKLKNDPSDYVSRSVANNLNDISRYHPQHVVDFCDRWYGHSDLTDKIVKHALRTLLKKGNKRAMMLFGFADPENLLVDNLRVSEKQIPIGGELHFSLQLNNTSPETKKVRLEYAINYVKLGTRRSRKVFQICEREFNSGSHALRRKHSMANMTTRTHYPGNHDLAINVNGIEKAKISFELLSKK